MHIILVDVDEAALEKATKSVKAVDGVGEVWGLKADVSRIDEVVALREKVFEEFGEVSPILRCASRRLMCRCTYSWPMLGSDDLHLPCLRRSRSPSCRRAGPQYSRQICMVSSMSVRHLPRGWPSKRTRVSSSIPAVNRVSPVPRKSHVLGPVSDPLI